MEVTKVIITAAVALDLMQEWNSQTSPIQCQVQTKEKTVASLLYVSSK